MKITKKQFLADVQHEVETLKRLATKEELASLDFKSFDYREKEGCIYGQMSGSCDSTRAKELMDKACVRVTNGEIRGTESIEGKTFTEIERYINGEYKGQTWIEGFNGRTYSYLSMLETYICLKGAKVKSIINYLKDESGTIKLKL